MAEGTPDVTLGTLHDDLVDLKGGIGGLTGEMGGLKIEMSGVRAEVRDLKAIVIAGFARMPTREQNEEILALLRELNRRQDAGFSELRTDLRLFHSENQELLRTQQAENQQLLRALVDGQRILIEENRALITRIDAIIRRQNNGGPSA